MKITISILLLALSLNILAQSQKLNLVSDVWPPFTNAENSKSVALDLVKIALQRVNVDTKYTITSFDNVIAGIENGKFDGSAALWESKERGASLIFSEPMLCSKYLAPNLDKSIVSFPVSNAKSKELSSKVLASKKKTLKIGEG